jgi:mRNA interferase MazF
MVIQQGDLYWIELEPPAGSEPGYSHPHVVVQNNVFNQSRLNTVLVCALTSNLRRTLAPGNVLLETGEGNLSKESVVVVSQLFTIDKAQLGEYIGSLSRKRVNQIIEGIRLVIEPREVE